MAPTPALSLVQVGLLAAATLGGCLGPTPTDGAAPAPDDRRTSVAITPESLQSPRHGLQVVIELTSDATLKVALKNGRPSPAPEGGWAGCGQALYQLVRHGSLEASDGFAWSESRGHGAFISAGGQSRTLDLAGSPESLFLGVDVARNGDLAARKGDRLVLGLSVDGPETVFEAEAAVQAEAPVLRIAEVEPFAFECAANISPFSGAFVSTGLPGVTQTTVQNATVRRDMDRYARVGFLLLPDPRFYGACETTIVANGSPVNHTSSSGGACNLAYLGPPGQIELRIDRATAYGMIVAYFLFDREPT